MGTRINTDLEALIEKLPPHIQKPLRQRNDIDELLEVVLDLGREPEARFLTESFFIDHCEVTEDNIQYVNDGVGSFGADNRAGIERTLHRISAIRNRNGKIVGLTLRVGRAVYGTTRIIEELISDGKSILLVGKPGVGKTTMLREIARVLADDTHKRVIVVDTSNEIAGDGDVPHPGIGHARRMQVPTPKLQHAVMIEAVENHMPEVIIVDEIGTELDTNAARTIAERGVQLVATAHGNTLENLIMNPTLSDLVGGVQAVTLGDDEARRRQTQKTVLERRAPPTFDALVEIQGWNCVVVHPDVADMVDRVLRGSPIDPEVRTLDKDGRIRRTLAQPRVVSKPNGHNSETPDPIPGMTDSKQITSKKTCILPYGINKGKLQQAIQSSDAPVTLVSEIGEAELLLTTKNFYRRRTKALQTAEREGKPVYVLRKNTTPQIDQFVRALKRKQNQPSDGAVIRAVEEAEKGVALIHTGKFQADLNPQGSFIRHVQHQIAEKYGLTSSSSGREPKRHVVIHRR